MTFDQLGNKVWRNEKGKWHREDGPAIEYTNGDKEWFIDGLRHRVGGPACELAGDKYWLVNGLRHRIEGPAVEWADGTKAWFVGDKNISRLVHELLSTSPFDKSIHLGILADYFAERGDFRLMDIVQPFLAESK